jgi:hypothetical protein
MLHFIHEICKAKPYDGQSIVYLHPKYDGHRITVLRQPKSYEYPFALYTRSRTDLYTDLTDKAEREDIWPWLIPFFNMPEKSSIDGELYVPGKPASYVKTAIKECDPTLKFVAFAVPWWKHIRRYVDPLEWAMDVCTQIGVEFIPFLKQEAASVNVEKLLETTPREQEGWVLKTYHYSQWYKVKKRHTVDLVVTGIEPGKGKYEGQAGALICSCWNVNRYIEICKCSGMTDEQRRNINGNCVGKVCEVAYQEVGALGRLRHPSFIRWREDKEVIECTIAQDSDLLNYWSNYGKEEQ